MLFKRKPKNPGSITPKSAGFFKLKTKESVVPGSGELSAYLAPLDERTSLAYGVNWLALDGFGTLEQQATRLANSNSAQRYCIVRPLTQRVEPVVGLLPKGLKILKGVTVEAAAACFALAIREDFALFIGPGPTSDTFVLVGVVHGLPSPEFDVVGNAAVIVHAASQFQSYLTDGHPFYVHKDIAQELEQLRLHRELAEFLQLYQSVVRSVPTLPYLSTVDSVSGGVMTPPSSNRTVLAVGGGVVALACLMGGYFAYDQWEQANSERAKEAALILAAKTAYQASIDTAFQSAGTQLALPAAKALWSQVSSLAIVRNGWHMRSVLCTKSDCEAIFERTPATTFKSFKAAERTGDTSVMALAKLDTASTTFSIPKFDEVPVLDLHQIEVTDVTVPLGTQAQLMTLAGLSVVVSNAEPMGDRALVQAKNIPVRKYVLGTWQIIGPLDTLIPAMSRLPANATLSAVTVTLGEGVTTYSASGRYFLSGK